MVLAFCVYLKLWYLKLGILQKYFTLFYSIPHFQGFSPKDCKVLLDPYL